MVSLGISVYVSGYWVMLVASGNDSTALGLSGFLHIFTNHAIPVSDIDVIDMNSYEHQ